MAESLAVLLVGFGGPECLEDVGPFMKSVTGVAMPPERLAGAVERYRLIGGCSPLNEISLKQAASLEAFLNAGGLEATVYVGMKNWRPGLEEAAAAIKASKPDRVVIMCLTPYYSAMSAGDYLRAAAAALAAAGVDAPVKKIESWYEEPSLIEAFARNLRNSRERAGLEAAILFTAHSLPVTLEESGDPYAAQVKETVKRTAAASDLSEWLFGWQSEGHGRGDWLKPTAEEALEQAIEKGARTIVVLAIGFISDHMETLYDLDIVLKGRAEEAGMTYVRAAGLNDNGLLTEAMGSAVMKAIGTEGSK